MLNREEWTMAHTIQTIYHGKPIERTDHPHVVKVHGVGSGEPIILGTAIMVRTLIEQYQLGSSIEELLWDYPQLSPAQIYDAIAYYHDHKEEMDHLLDEATYEHWQPIIEQMTYEQTKTLQRHFPVGLINPSIKIEFLVHGFLRPFLFYCSYL